jgi:hypothetical protein
MWDLETRQIANTFHRDNLALLCHGLVGKKGEYALGVEEGMSKYDG